MSLGRIVLGACVCGLAIAVPGCGGEREFTAAELVGELRDEGAPIQLEEPLRSEQEGVEVHGVSISGVAAAGEHSHAEGAASLAVAESEELALEEFSRCETAVTLICFRVANCVLTLGDDDPETLAKLEAAVRAMESD